MVRSLGKRSNYEEANVEFEVNYWIMVNFPSSMTGAAATPVCFNPEQYRIQIETSSISLKTKNGAAGSKFFKTEFELRLI